MKNLKKTELVLLLLTLLCLFFTAGYFVGRGAPVGAVTVERLAPASPSVDALPPASPAARLNINSATEAELCDLPGIGPATARSIVAYRTENGHFKAIDEIMDVSGIGAAKYSAIRDLIAVE